MSEKALKNKNELLRYEQNMFLKNTEDSAAPSILRAIPATPAVLHAVNKLPAYVGAINLRSDSKMPGCVIRTDIA